MKKMFSILLVMGLLLTGCNSSIKVETDTAVEVSKPVYVMAGIVDANEKAQITSKLSAKVSGISVEVGSAVKKAIP